MVYEYEYELFDHLDHTCCRNFYQSPESVQIGDIIQYGLPVKHEYEVMGKKHIVRQNRCENIKVVLYVKKKEGPHRVLKRSGRYPWKQKGE